MRLQHTGKNRMIPYLISGVLVLIKNDILRFLGEPEGEFMAVIPVGYAARPASGPNKRPLEMVVKQL